MKKVLIDYTKRTAEAVVTVANNVSEKLYAVAAFATAPVTKVILDAQIAKLNDAMVAASTRDRAMLAALRNIKTKLAGMLRQNAEFVNTTVTNGDEEQLLSSGFEVSKTPEKNQLPAAVKRIDAKYTNLSGSINLVWQRAKNARYYHVFMSSDNGSTWTLLKSEFSRKLLVQNLASGTRYRFKVVPVGIHGIGPESDVASQFAA